jgi:hypothetical protein
MIREKILSNPASRSFEAASPVGCHENEIATSLTCSVDNAFVRAIARLCDGFVGDTTGQRGSLGFRQDGSGVSGRLIGELAR